MNLPATLKVNDLMRVIPVNDATIRQWIATLPSSSISALPLRVDTPLVLETWLPPELSPEQGYIDAKARMKRASYVNFFADLLAGRDTYITTNALVKRFGGYPKGMVRICHLLGIRSFHSRRFGGNRLHFSLNDCELYAKDITWAVKERRMQCVSRSAAARVFGVQPMAISIYRADPNIDITYEGSIDISPQKLFTMWLPPHLRVMTAETQPERARYEALFHKLIAGTEVLASPAMCQRILLISEYERRILEDGNRLVATTRTPNGERRYYMPWLYDLWRELQPPDADLTYEAFATKVREVTGRSA